MKAARELPTRPAIAVAVLCAAFGCGGTTANDVTAAPAADASSESVGSGGSSGAAGAGGAAGGGGSAGAGGGAADADAGDALATDAGADAAVCADLAAAADALLDKHCASSAECSVTRVYNCCTVYTGIRADAKAAFEAAQAAHDSACPDLRGCACQDHTETGDLVPAQQPPLAVVATCDSATCTAHVQP